MKTARLLLLLALLLLGAMPGRATDIRSIDTEVWLHKNGNAVVHQRWDVTITGGTEWYIPITRLGQRGIRDFIVYEDDRRFENDGREWNSDRTLEQKMYRCGIVDKRDGVELCWGQGRPGDHVFDIIYIIDNLVQASADGENDAFNWQFLNDEWSANPQRVSLKMYNLADSTQVWKAGEAGNMGVWVFGCEADYGVEDGEVRIESTEPFDYLSHLTVLMRFDKGLFDPRTTDSRSFEQLQSDAMAGSDYALPTDDDRPIRNPLARIGLFLLFLGGFFLAIVLVVVWIPKGFLWIWRSVFGFRYSRTFFGKSRITGWWRDLPFEGNLCACYSLLWVGDKLSETKELFPRLVGAYFLRWVHKGLVTCEKDPAQEGRMNLRFVPSSPEALSVNDPMEAKIYHAARLAAGDNLLLEDSEFKKWTHDRYVTVGDWPDQAYNDGKPVWWSRSEEERCRLVQFKNYLEDFTLSKIREAPEVTLWEEYLVFAQLFGIADKVSHNLEKLYPDVYRKYVGQLHLTDTDTLLRSVHHYSSTLASVPRYVTSYSSSYSSSRSSSSSSSSRTRYYGGGGHSSHRGGGGHSGGGHGGGSR